MDLEQLIKHVNVIYNDGLDEIVKGIRENTNDPDEVSYDIEEIENFGDLMDLLVDEKELITLWDVPYVAHVITHRPYDLYHYLFEGLDVS